MLSVFWQNSEDCSETIFEYKEDDTCLVNEIKNRHHGRLNPSGNYSFDINPPELAGQLGVPLFVDKLLGTKEIEMIQ